MPTPPLGSASLRCMESLSVAPKRSWGVNNSKQATKTLAHISSHHAPEMERCQHTNPVILSDHQMEASLSALPDDVLRHTITLMTLQSRLCLCGVSRGLLTLVAPVIPRQYLLARVQGLVQEDRIESRPVLPRRCLRHPPSLSLVPTGAQTSLFIDLDFRSPPEVQHLATEIMAVGKHLPGLRVLSVISYQTRLQQVMDSLTPAMRSSIVTVRLARHYSDFSVPVPLLVATRGCGMPMLTSVKLMRVSADLERLGAVCPNLTSLHVSEDHNGSVTGWKHMASSLSRLRDLRVTSRSVLGLLSCDALDGLMSAPPRELTSLGLMGIGNASTMYAAAASIKGNCLRSLSLRLSSAQRLSGMWEAAECQFALDQTAVSHPGLTHLELDANRKIRIPEAWESLTNITSLHTTPIPGLPSITALVIRWAMTFSFRPSRLIPLLPPHLVRLEIPYGLLRSALACQSLHELVWTPHAQGCFPGSEQANLLAEVARQDAWPSLRRILVLPTRLRGTWVLSDEPGEARRHCRHSAQLLTLLGSMVSCGVTHVTVFQRSAQQFGMVEALCKMTSLESVTLVKMRITAMQLRRLVHMQHMRVVELVGATQLSKRQFDCVREDAGEVRMLWRTMDIMRGGNVLDEDDERD